MALEMRPGALQVTERLPDRRRDRESPVLGNVPYILLVEDDADTRELICKTLEEAGLTVQVAEDGAAALDAVVRARRPPSLLILDLALPRLEGEALAKEIQILADVPILIASGAREEEIAGVAGRIKARSWIRKPFDLAEMEQRVMGLLG